MSQPRSQEASTQSGGSYQYTEEAQRDDREREAEEDEEDGEEELSSPSTDEEDEEWVPGSTKPPSKRGSRRHPFTSRLPSSSSSSYSSFQHPTSSSSFPTRESFLYPQLSTSSSSSSQHQPSQTSLQNEPPASRSSSNSPPPQQPSTEKPFNPSTSRKRLRVGPKPRRFQSNAKQVEIFMASFEQAERPSKQERLRLAAEATRLITDPGTTVTERNVNVWFQNRRQHLRQADRGMRPPPVSVKRRRSDEEASSASPRLSPSLAPPSLHQHHEYLRRNFLFEASPVVVIPASSLVVATWVRNLTTPSFSPSGPPPPPPDLILYANPSQKYFAWYISHAGRGYKMHLPFSTITGFQIAPAGSSSTSECVFSVNSPPRMWCTKMRDGRVDVGAEGGPWEVIGDFTEGVVSQAREHKIKGADSTMISTILNIITSNSELSHLLSSTQPLPYLSMPPPSNSPSSFGPVSSTTSSPGSSSTMHFLPAPRISPSSSVARLSLGPFQDAITSNTPPFSISRLPVVRPFSSAGERSTSSDLRGTFGSSGHGHRPWTTGEEWEPRVKLEHAAPPLPRQQYLPPPLAPAVPPPRQRYESEGFYGGDQSSSSSYGYGGGGGGELSSPGSSSEQFRYQQPSNYSYSYQGQDMPQQHQQHYEDPSRPVQQPHQRFISAPLSTPRRESAPASSTRPQTSHYARPPPRGSLPHLSPPSSSTSWSTVRPAANPWPYPFDSSSSSARGPSSFPPQSSSEFSSFTPAFAPQQPSYQPQSYRPSQLDPHHQQQQHQVAQYKLSPSQSAEGMEFEQSYDASSEPSSYGHHGPPPPPPSRGGRGGYGGSSQ